MDMAQYYLTTLSKAFTKIGPLIGFIVVGYFIFFKLPFLFFLKNMKKSKEELGVKADATEAPAKKPSTAVEDYNHFIRQNKQQKSEKKEPLRLADANGPKREAPPASPEELFELRAGEKISKDDLRKKYHELLRQNHPDKVASLSPEFRSLADRKTKQINEAYAKLLKRAV